MTKTQLRARLMERGTTIRRFALDRGYEPSSSANAIDRWVGKKTLPRGRLTFQILLDLSREIGQEVIPGLLAANTKSRSITANNQ